MKKKFTRVIAFMLAMIVTLFDFPIVSYAFDYSTGVNLEQSNYLTLTKYHQSGTVQDILDKYTMSGNVPQTLTVKAILVNNKICSDESYIRYSDDNTLYLKSSADGFSEDAVQDAISQGYAYSDNGYLYCSLYNPDDGLNIPTISFNDCNIKVYFEAKGNEVYDYALAGSSIEDFRLEDSDGNKINYTIYDLTNLTRIGEFSNYEAPSCETDGSVKVSMNEEILNHFGSVKYADVGYLLSSTNDNQLFEITLNDTLSLVGASTIKGSETGQFYYSSDDKLYGFGQVSQYIKDYFGLDSSNIGKYFEVKDNTWTFSSTYSDFTGTDTYDRYWIEKNMYGGYLFCIDSTGALHNGIDTSNWSMYKNETTEVSYSNVRDTSLATALFVMPTSKYTFYTINGSTYTAVDLSNNYPIITYKDCDAFGVPDSTNTMNIPIDATGHNWSSWETTVEPTINTTGTRTRTCSVCGEVETETIPVLYSSNLKGTIRLGDTGLSGYTVTVTNNADTSDKHTSSTTSSGDFSFNKLGEATYTVIVADDSSNTILTGVLVVDEENGNTFERTTIDKNYNISDTSGWNDDYSLYTLNIVNEPYVASATFTGTVIDSEGNTSGSVKLTIDGTDNPIASNGTWSKTLQQGDHAVSITWGDNTIWSGTFSVDGDDKGTITTDEADSTFDLTKVEGSSPSLTLVATSAYFHIPDEITFNLTSEFDTGVSPSDLIIQLDGSTIAEGSHVVEDGTHSIEYKTSDGNTVASYSVTTALSSETGATIDYTVNSIATTYTHTMSKNEQEGTFNVNVIAPEVIVTGSLELNIVDSNGDPVQYVDVTLDDSTSTAGATGIFKQGTLSAGTHTISVSYNSSLILSGVINVDSSTSQLQTGYTLASGYSITQSAEGTALTLILVKSSSSSSSSGSSSSDPYRGVVTISDIDTYTPTDALKEAQYTSVDKIKSTLEQAAVREGYSTANTYICDVSLMFTKDGTSWINATKDTWPEEGIKFTVPYPDGSSKNSDFYVQHMLAYDNGTQAAGSIEVPTWEATSSGLQIVLTSASPLAISYTKSSGSESVDVDGYLKGLFLNFDTSSINSYIVQVTGTGATYTTTPDTTTGEWSISGLDAGSYTVRIYDNTSTLYYGTVQISGTSSDGVVTYSYETTDLSVANGYKATVTKAGQLCVYYLSLADGTKVTKNEDGGTTTTVTDEDGTVTTTTTDKDGNIETTVVKTDGSYTTTTTYADGSPSKTVIHYSNGTTITLYNGNTTVTTEDAATGVVFSGTAQNQSGSGLAGLNVTLKSSSNTYEATTDSTGYWSVKDVASGNYQVAVTYGTTSLYTGTASVSVSNGKITVETAKNNLNEAFDMSVNNLSVGPYYYLTAAKGYEIKMTKNGLEYSYYDEDDKSTTKTTIGSDGAVTTTRTNADGTSSTSVTDKDGNTTNTVTGILTGKAVNASSNGLANVQVYLGTKDNANEYYDVTGGDGSFNITGIESGTYTLKLRNKNQVVYEGEFTVAYTGNSLKNKSAASGWAVSSKHSAQTSTLNITVDTTETVLDNATTALKASDTVSSTESANGNTSTGIVFSGVVVTKQAQGLKGINANIYNSENSYSSTTNASGYWSCSNMQPGTYTVAIYYGSGTILYSGTATVKNNKGTITVTTADNAKHPAFTAAVKTLDVGPYYTLTTADGYSDMAMGPNYLTYKQVSDEQTVTTYIYTDGTIKTVTEKKDGTVTEKTEKASGDTTTTTTTSDGKTTTTSESGSSSSSSSDGKVLQSALTGTGTFKGGIYKTDNSGVVGAVITIKRDGYNEITATTDSSGIWQVDSIADGSYSVSVSQDGVNVFYGTLTIGDNSTMVKKTISPSYVFDTANDGRNVAMTLNATTENIVAASVPKTGESIIITIALILLGVTILFFAGFYIYTKKYSINQK